MKIKYVVFASLLLILTTKASSSPLIIRNISKSALSFDVSLKSGNQTISLDPQGRWEHEMQNDRFVRLTWKDYSDADNAWHIYFIKIQEQAPALYNNGGKLVIGKNGTFLWDIGKGIEGGKAQQIDTP